MGLFDSVDAKSLALIVALFATLTSKSIKNPAKAAIIGSWISIFGEILEAIADTEEFIEEREAEKKQIKREIDELQRRLERLNND
ncbi:MAG: hypothetical protein JJT76_03580 [Clostridiaceae bacterium]|nr:hypothetical protein [Clostridiaceae bacterium]